MSKTTVQVIQDFFSPPKVTMDEFKALSAKERKELADLVAKQQGLTPTTQDTGVTTYE